MSDALLSALAGSEKSIRSLLERKLKAAEKNVSRAEDKAAVAGQNVQEKKKVVEGIVAAIKELDAKEAAATEAEPQSAQIPGQEPS